MVEVYDLFLVLVMVTAEMSDVTVLLPVWSGVLRCTGAVHVCTGVLVHDCTVAVHICTGVLDCTGVNVLGMLSLLVLG